MPVSLRLSLLLFVAALACVRPAYAQPEFVEERPPQLVSSIRLEYPPEAREKKIEGKVVVALLIDTNGRVGRMTIRQSDNALLDEAAKAAMKDARFLPATQNGKPMKSWYLQTLTFKLSDEKVRQEHRAIDSPPVPLEPIGNYYPYPMDAKDAGVEGWVTVQMLVDTTGGVDTIEVLGASSPIFSETAVYTMSRARFIPAIDSGRAVRAWYKQSFRFELPNKHAPRVVGLDSNINAAPVLLGEVPLFASSTVSERTATTLRMLVGDNGIVGAVLALDHNVDESIRSQIVEIAYRLQFAPGLIQNKVSEMWTDVTFTVLPETEEKQ